MRPCSLWIQRLLRTVSGFIILMFAAQPGAAQPSAVQTDMLEPIRAENAEKLERLGTVAQTERLEVLFSADGRYLIIWNLRAPTAELWDLATGQPLGTRSLRVDDEYVRILGAADTTISTSSGLWTLPDGELLLTYPDEMIGYHPGTGTLVSLADGGVKLWRLTAGGEVEEGALLTSREGVLRDSARFSADGTRLRMATFDNSNNLVTLLWDTRSGEQLGRYVLPEDYFSMVLTPDGAVLFTRREGAALQLLDAVSGERLPDFVIPGDTLIANEAAVSYLASMLVFSQDGVLAFNQRCSRVSRVRSDACGAAALWLFEVETREPLFSLDVADYNDLLFSVDPTIHPQRQMFVFQNGDLDIEFWGVPSEDACRVTALQSARLRRSPDASSEQVSGLATGDSQIAFAQALGSDGYVWWGGIGAWVRSDLVSETGLCESLPIIE